MQRKNKAYGYFSSKRFTSRDELEVTDEIALNPSHFRDRTDDQILSTLAHEMVHLWQYQFGKPSLSGYHNREWAEKMKAVGLMPSNTGQPGGRETGQQMSHYIISEGPFAAVCAELLNRGIKVRYVEKTAARNTKRSDSKVKYSCPACGLNAWAKPGARLICDQCQTSLCGPSYALRSGALPRASDRIPEPHA